MARAYYYTRWQGHTTMAAKQVASIPMARACCYGQSGSQAPVSLAAKRHREGVWEEGLLGMPSSSQRARGPRKRHAESKGGRQDTMPCCQTVCESAKGNTALRFLWSPTWRSTARDTGAHSLALASAGDTGAECPSLPEFGIQ